MQTLKTAYLEGLRQRAHAVSEALKLWDSGDPEGLSALRNQAHSLRGTGGTFGFPDISVAAAAVEESTEETVSELTQALLEVISKTIEESPQGERAQRLLVIEGHAETAQDIFAALDSPTREILCAASVERAETLMRQHDFDLIILDLVLSDGDGRRLISRVRNQRRTSLVPLIVMTPLADAQTRAECYAMGADEVMLKPLEVSTLAASVSAKLSRELQTDALLLRDPVTGLIHRRAFLTDFARTQLLAERAHFKCTVALLDIDAFGRMNHLLGRSAGDQLLQEFARRLRNALRRSDSVTRWSKDAFAVLFGATDESEALRNLRAFKQSLEDEPVALKDLKLPDPLRFSAGITEVPPSMAPDAAVARADWFLFEAKSAKGRSLICASEHQHEEIPLVLVADDDEEIRSLIAKHLEAGGFNTLAAANGDEAYALAHQHQFNLAIVDVKMPEMDGFELLGRMKRSSTLSEIPVCMLTSMGDEKSLVKAFDLGADDYVVKPFAPEELLARTQRLVRIHAKQAQRDGR